MFELFALFALVIIAALAFKGLFWVLKAGLWTLTLPLQLLAGVLVFAIAIPLGLIAGILGLIVLPVALLSAALPLLLLGAGIYLLMRQ
ncbi:hypothetical protein KJ068_04080 [bacterium]|nr:MAG: hypothetical protein EDS67_14710 [candidate division KSB1 bacterium]MCE7940976.1 hypothetical protein [Chlorobi bacterium CHB1]MCL4704313.1 hypothetical protein [bacterium]MDL1875012.1 hypothetical protein [Cytophagia bacterium CHB2]NUM75702.1 hypothetical protein [candidate division KSB1 bacterium]